METKNSNYLWKEAKKPLYIHMIAIQAIIPAPTETVTYRGVGYRIGFSIINNSPDQLILQGPDITLHQMLNDLYTNNKIYATLCTGGIKMRNTSTGAYYECPAVTLQWSSTYNDFTFVYIYPDGTNWVGQHALKNSNNSKDISYTPGTATGWNETIVQIK